MSGALRRVGVVVLVYAAAAWAVLGGAAWLRRALALPALFDVLLRAGLLLGLGVAAALAWRYPALGEGSRTPATMGEDH